MTDVITKVSIGGQVYPFAGGCSEGQEVVYLTQAEYDALPASKLTDGKIYKVKTTGVVPGSVIDSDEVGYDNTDSGLTATNVQDAIDEVSTKIVGMQTVTLDGSIVLNKINAITETDNSIFYEAFGGYDYWNVFGKNGALLYRTPSQTIQSSCVRKWCTYKNFIIFCIIKGTSSSSGYYLKLNLDNLTTENITPDMFGLTVLYDSSSFKCVGDYIYFQANKNDSSDPYRYRKALLSDFTNLIEITQQEYEDADDYSNSIDGLFYAQDNDDYVATDINGTEVKRYVGVGTITGIANGKLWRTVGDVSYAIATI